MSELTLRMAHVEALDAMEHDEPVVITCTDVFRNTYRAVGRISEHQLINVVVRGPRGFNYGIDTVADQDLVPIKVKAGWQRKLYEAVQRKSKIVSVE
jgi:hypothetical protein